MIPRFRAWHKEKKKMFRIEQITFYWGKYAGNPAYITPARDQVFTYRQRKNPNWVNKMPHWSINEVVLTQSIGLKDKNGKEIFEGDILQRKPISDKYIGVVYYSKTAFVLKLKILRKRKAILEYNDFGFCGYKDWKIIGNVYKNPELLKVKK
jgi:uncharacterized phage protein (TIGR01671 family)